jgi:hypothetical protein
MSDPAVGQVVNLRRVANPPTGAGQIDAPGNQDYPA